MNTNLEKAKQFIKKNTPNYNNRYRLNYHLMAPIGWINDPNGLTYYSGEYHAFYQYHPYDKDWGPMHWGHAKSKDMVQWEHLPVALAPGDVFDQGGCYSGSAVDNHGELTLIYTGHIFDDPNNRDPFSPDFHQNQNIAISMDGIHFEKYSLNPVIPEPPQDNTQNFRDPKVWFNQGEWNMVVGSTSKDMLGRTILYRSPDLKEWTYIGVLATSDGSLGSMWECPDFFELDGQYVQLFSPVGMEPQGERYNNVFQTGAIVGSYDYEENHFDHGAFEEMDRGHDFYAVQTFMTPDGRRVGIGWMNMWQTHMPEKEDNWAGAFTIPRELHVVNSQVQMTPVKELEGLRDGVLFEEEKMNLAKDAQVLLPGNSAEILLNLTPNTTARTIGFRLCDKEGELVSFTYDAKKQALVLVRRGEDGIRSCKTKVLDNLALQVYIDKSSIEIFVNQGQEVFTSRMYPKGECTFELVNLQNVVTASIAAYKLKKVIDC